MVELIWDGKYDARGRRVAPSRLRLPFQTVETVNESAELRQRSLFGGARETGWRNRLIWGDKRYVLPALLDEFAGQVDLIYIDPPFATGADFTFQVEVEGEEFTKQASIIEQKAYRDTWGRGLDSYLQWFYETVILLRDLLKGNGSIFVHCDWHVNSVMRVVLDELFGSELFRNEIIWKRKTGRGQTNKAPSEFGTQTDSILFYSKSDGNSFRDIIKPLKEEYIRNFYKYVDENGRRFRIADLSSPSPRPNLRYEYKGYSPPKNGWAISQEKMVQWDAEGRLHFPKEKDGRIQRKRYLDENEGEVVQNLWDDISIAGPQSDERLDYPTQKPEALLERIINASSNEGDLILDCFCGSGTTAAVAERLGRRWIAADLGRFAVHTTRKRLLSMADVRPFVVQNLGKYERQAWQTAEFGDDGPEGAVRAAEISKAYRRFILDLYGARPMEGYAWLHGAKAGRLVHVGPVDSPITPGDVTQIALEFRKAMGRGTDAPTTAGVDVLGWDFAFELNEVARQQAEAARLDVRFVRIPREVLEKKAVEQGDIRFFELAALSVEVHVETFRRNVSSAGEERRSSGTSPLRGEERRSSGTSPLRGEERRSSGTSLPGRDVTVKLTDFVIPPDDVPADVQAAISHWAQWIDYWAVDWDNNGDTFHNMWQAYRTRGKKKGGEALQLQTTHRYDAAGEYTIMVKVIDILGNDTTKTVRVNVV